MTAEPVVIVPYDRDWPHRFERERDVLRQVFRGTRAVIEHVGSTAVPALGAKPILDIMVGVAALQEVEIRIPELESRGYEYVPKYEAQLPERRYFVKPRLRPRTPSSLCGARRRVLAPSPRVPRPPPLASEVGR